MSDSGTMNASLNAQDWMTPEEFRMWFHRLKAIDAKLTHAGLGERLDVRQSTITRWLKDTPGTGRPDDNAPGRRIENGAMLHLALERLEQILIEERRPKRRSARRAEGAGGGGGG